MSGYSLSWLTILLASLLVPAQIAAQQPSDGDPSGLLEQAMKQAVARVAPSVVQIETSGGTDVVGSGQQQFRTGTGPTTGLVVAPEGYIISSAFNFANKPSSILVTIPGQKERLVAKVIATDHSRMLTLLKADVAKLAVPQAAAKKDIRVGQWALALGRTWTGAGGPPSVSIGIVSALGRIWGKAIQTDAKVSPVNYGGPLIDLDGRVLGVLIPASPTGQGETAGVEWYDSGIGFAVPLEDINAVLPKLKKGINLERGQLGVRMQSMDIYGAAPVVAGAIPDSAAMKAGIKAGDIITEINGVAITRQAQLQHALGDKYEGETVSLKVKRGKEEVRFADIRLTGAVSAFGHSFLGILPVRDDPEPGVEVRYVFPKSAADIAGLKPGDRIMQIGGSTTPLQPFSGRNGLAALLNHVSAGTELKLEVSRKEAKKIETLKVTLGVFSETVPDELPESASRKKALERPKPVPRPRPVTSPDLKIVPRGPAPKKKAEPKPEVAKPAPKPETKKEKKKAETGLLKRATAARDNEYWLYVPEDYDPNIAYALVVWLHPAGSKRDKNQEAEQLIDAWKEFCRTRHIIMLCPKAGSESGWLASETDFIQQTIRDVLAEYTIDRQRIVAHGMGIGGQMAYYLGFYTRDLVRGVATTGAVLTNQPKENQPALRLSFFLIAGEKDPLRPAIAESKTKLTEHKFPVVYREIAEMGHQYLDEATLHELLRWIDSLDRL